MNIKVGKTAPDFCLLNQYGNEMCLSSFRGKWVILYFYPRDNTSGCTKEAVNFTEKIDEFNKKNAVIIGVSPDSVKSHWNFMNKHDLKIILLSDVDKEIMDMYNVLGLKKRYGKEYIGVIRSTFLIDPDGKIVYIWRNVKVSGHVDEVYNMLANIEASR
jgi:peroxiredoxin Q/BCP